MKANKLALFLYFSACFFSVFFYLINMEWILAYTKAIVIPTIFFYYCESSKFRVGFIKIAVFALCFLGEIIFIMGYDYSFIVSLFCFMLVNLLLLRYFILDFRKSRFRWIDVLPFAIVIAFLTCLFVTILNLNFEDGEKYFPAFLIYGVILEIMGIVAVLNFVSRGSAASMYAVLMFICFMLSDIFYLLYNYYLSIPVFHAINIATQVLSYFFMTLYFIENKKPVSYSKRNDLNL